MDAVRAIADAVLYEGYILWPYRRDTLKNTRRWTFGGVFPPAHAARHPDDRSTVGAEVLLDGDGPVEVRARFLHVAEREAGEFDAWEQGTEREVGPGPFEIPAGAEGGLRWAALRGTLEVERSPGRVRAALVNRTPWEGASRERALRHTFCAAHLVLRAGPGAVLHSQQDPPEHLCEATGALRNEGLWPVLVGEPGSRDCVLASPFILEDHPRIAPESPGDFFDGGEIDQMLVLNILSLTDEEKAQMRACDPRAREILERVEALGPGEIMQLHGALR